MVFERSPLPLDTLECAHGDVLRDGWQVELCAQNNLWLTYLSGAHLVHIFCGGDGAIIRTERSGRVIEVVWRATSPGKRQPK